MSTSAMGLPLWASISIFGMTVFVSQEMYSNFRSGYSSLIYLRAVSASAVVA